MKIQNPNFKIQRNDKIPSPNHLSFVIRILFVICHLSFVIFLCGCAKTETPLFSAGKHLTIDINFKGNIDTTLNKYYIIFNNNAAPKIPFMPEEFVEPGETPSQPDVDYYGKYYPTWKNYIVLDGNSFYFVKGPFTSEAAPTKEVMAVWSGAESRKIAFTMDMAKLAPTADRLNFDFITVDKASKIVKDNLSPLNSSPSPYYVFTISDSIAEGRDETTAVSRESLDILDWRVIIQ